MSTPAINSPLTYIPFPERLVGTGRIYRTPMPLPGEVIGFKDKYNISKVVQLCFDEEFRGAHEPVPDLYRKEELRVRKFPIKDFQAPADKAAARELIDEILEDLRSGKNLLIHCLAGNGRTGMILACLARKVFNINGDDALDWIKTLIPRACRKPVQQEFLKTVFEEEPSPEGRKTEPAEPAPDQKTLSVFSCCSTQ